MKRTATALLLAFAISIPAQAGIFLDIPDIPGDSMNSLHENEIDVLTWGQSVANLNNMPVVLPLVITHSFDMASPKLIEAAILGTELELATLTVTTMWAELEFDYIILTLGRPRIVSVSSGGADEALPVETVTLTCTSFELRYRSRMSDGSPGPFTEVSGSCGN